MSDLDWKVSLREQLTRRLQKLQEKLALQGYSADPEISLEIEDIGMKLSDLDVEIARLRASARQATPPTGTSQSSSNTDSSPDIGVHNTISFHAPVGAIHMGRGDININGHPSLAEPDLFVLLHGRVRKLAPDDIRDSALRKVEDALDAFRAKNHEDLTYALDWLQRHIPALSGLLGDIRRHFDDPTRAKRWANE